MPALLLTIRPVDSGKTAETALVNGSISEGVLQVTEAQSGAFNSFLAKVRAGEDTSVVNTVLELPSTEGVEAYLALDDADVLEVVDAAVGLENMSPAQKAGLLAYIAAIIAEEDTSDVETAIDEIGGE